MDVRKNSKHTVRRTDAHSDDHRSAVTDKQLVVPARFVTYRYAAGVCCLVQHPEIPHNHPCPASPADSHGCHARSAVRTHRMQIHPFFLYATYEPLSELSLSGARADVYPAFLLFRTVYRKTRPRKNPEKTQMDGGDLRAHNHRLSHQRSSSSGIPHCFPRRQSDRAFHYMLYIVDVPGHHHRNIICHYTAPQPHFQHKKICPAALLFSSDRQCDADSNGYLRSYHDRTAEDNLSACIHLYDDRLLGILHNHRACALKQQIYASDGLSPSQYADNRQKR